MTKDTKTKMTLNSLSSIGTSKNRKRVGRGIGSGTGKTPTNVSTTYTSKPMWTTTIDGGTF